MDAMVNEEAKEGKPKRKRFRRSREDRIISGFCGGLGEYFDIDPVLVRLGFLAIFLFVPSGLGFIFFYIIGAIVTPLERKQKDEEG
jgi:phage shock protein C